MASENATDSGERPVTIGQAMKLARVSRRTIYNWLSAGRLQYTRTTGGQVRIVPASLFAAANGGDKYAGRTTTIPTVPEAASGGQPRAPLPEPRVPLPMPARLDLAVLILSGLLAHVNRLDPLTGDRDYWCRLALAWADDLLAVADEDET